MTVFGTAVGGSIPSSGTSAFALHASLSALVADGVIGQAALDKAIRVVSNTWRDFWDAAFDIGRNTTLIRSNYMLGEIGRAHV